MVRRLGAELPRPVTGLPQERPGSDTAAARRDPERSAAEPRRAGGFKHRRPGERGAPRTAQRALVKGRLGGQGLRSVTDSLFHHAVEHPSRDGNACFAQISSG